MLQLNETKRMLAFTWVQLIKIILSSFATYGAQKPWQFLWMQGSLVCCPSELTGINITFGPKNTWCLFNTWMFYNPETAFMQNN